MAFQMYRNTDDEELHRNVSDIIERLDSLTSGHKILSDQASANRMAERIDSLTSDEIRKGDLAEALSVIAGGTSLALRMVSVMYQSLGECRREVPFSKLQPVIDAAGNFKWCCNHDPEHCS